MVIQLTTIALTQGGCCKLGLGCTQVTGQCSNQTLVSSHYDVIYLSKRGQLLSDLHLSGSRTRKKAAILGESLEGIDTIIHRPLDVIHDIVGGATNHHSGDLARLLVCRRERERDEGHPFICYLYTVEPLYCGHLGDLVKCPV